VAREEQRRRERKTGEKLKRKIGMMGGKVAKKPLLPETI